MKTGTLSPTVPIVMLSGFLGSGKTTLLTNMLEFYKQNQIRPAVIMNEVGDVNLDGLLVDDEISMREMLSGCICCTISGDLSTELRELIQDASPDLILIEATGVANPMEILDAVTDAALFIPIDVHAMISVVDAGHFLHWSRKGKGKTYHLMTDQIRCASILLLNKTDLISAGELEEAKRMLAALNPHAAIHATTYCNIQDEWLDRVFRVPEPIRMGDVRRDERDRHSSSSDHTDTLQSHEHHEHEQHDHQSCSHEHHGHQQHDHKHDDHKHDDHKHDDHKHHHTHDHVMVYTHYFDQPIDSERFEHLISELPDNIYRAKGVFTAAETGERMLFQFAYRHLELLRVKPQGTVQDVVVFIGEQFSKSDLQEKLEACTTRETN